ncbi:MAG: glycoside hydrolase family 31 protein [Bacteroidota bacterium]
MRTHYYLVSFVFILLLKTTYLFSQVQKAGPFTKFPNRLQWEDNGELFWIDPFGPNTLRFRSSRSLRISEENWSLLSQPEVQLEITISEDKAIVKNGKIKAEIEAKDGRVKYLNNREEILLHESHHRHHSHFARQFKSRGSDHFELKVTFDTDKDEHLYGMGQYPNDCLDLKGTVLELAQKNTQISIPFLLSSKGYGFIWNNPAIGRAELSKTHTSFYSKYAKQIDYVIYAGDLPAEIVKKYSDLTGKSPEMPYFATGFWQSKLRYSSQEELLSVAREYKKRELPISVIVADFYHWPTSGDWKFNPEFWPDPERMIAELESMGIKLLVSVWPTLNIKSENYNKFIHNNYTIRPELGNNVFLSIIYKQANAIDNLTFVDATHPDARNLFWSKIKDNYFDIGVRLFWLDEAEPEIDPLDYENLRYYIGNGLEVSNIYPYYLAKTFYEGQRQNNQNEIINLIRSGWIGSQRFGTILWSGDIYGTWNSLRRQIKAGLNISLCGIPWWNSDIGGFYGDSESVEYRELLIRWFQYGTFCPIMRLHGIRYPYQDIEGQTVGTGAPNEVWSYGEDAYKIMTHYLEIREKLRPYIMKHMKRSSLDGTPMMRPLFYDFPKDETCYSIEDQYMFGPDLLIAPVYESKVKLRKVYLPAGSKWKDCLTGIEYKGGQIIEIGVSLDHIPVFSRNGFEFSIK